MVGKRAIGIGEEGEAKRVDHQRQGSRNNNRRYDGDGEDGDGDG